MYATREDVFECYRKILGREPENDAIVLAHLESAPSFWELIKGFAQSTELLNSTIGPLVRHKFEQHRYLANSFTGKINCDCFFHNYVFLCRELPPLTFEQMLYKDAVLLEGRIGEESYTASIQMSRDHQNEGELSLQFQTTGLHLYTLSFTIVPGHVLDLPDRDVFLISRMQGKIGTFEEFRRVTKAINEISPQAVLFAVLKGIAQAVGVRFIAGTSATNTVVYDDEKAEMLKQAYDEFFISIGATGPNKGFYISDLSLPPKPIALVKHGHRLRTKLKRTIKNGISNSACMAWLILVKPKSLGQLCNPGTGWGIDNFGQYSLWAFGNGHRMSSEASTCTR